MGTEHLIKFFKIIHIYFQLISRSNIWFNKTYFPPHTLLELKWPPKHIINTSLGYGIIDFPCTLQGWLLNLLNQPHTVLDPQGWHTVSLIVSAVQQQSSVQSQIWCHFLKWPFKTFGQTWSKTGWLVSRSSKVRTKFLLGVFALLIWHCHFFVVNVGTNWNKNVTCCTHCIHLEMFRTKLGDHLHISGLIYWSTL